MTSRDVAARVGVSQSAVSRAFTPGASISPDLKERIVTAARELGYRPSRLPGMILSGRSNMIAVVVGGFANPFHALASEAICRALGANGKRAMLVPVNSDSEIDSVVDSLMEYRVDAIITSLSIQSAEAAERLSRHGVPVVVVNAAEQLPGIHNILAGNEAAGEQAARLLIGRGHRHMAFVGGPAESSVSDARLAGFRMALAELGAPEPIVLPGDYLVSGGLAAADTLLNAPSIPDALLCVNDLTAIGLIDGLRAGGCARLPAVIGFDDIPAASWHAYDLTTFRQNIDAMAALAIECVDHSFENSARKLVIPSQLVIRSSA